MRPLLPRFRPVDPATLEQGLTQIERDFVTLFGIVGALGQVVEGLSGAHIHTIGQVAGLQGALDGKESVGHAHTLAQVIGLVAALDALTAALATKAAAVHGHAQDEITGLVAALALKAAATHAHAEGDVTGLTAALAAKAAAIHTHVMNDITGLAAALAAKADSGHTHAQSAVTGLEAALAARELVASKGQANGYAGLDGTGKVPLPQLPALGGGSISVVKKTADQQSIATALADVTDLTFTLLPNTDYGFEFLVLFRTPATTTGINLSVQGPASPAEAAWSSDIMLSGAAGTDGYQSKAQVAGDAAHLTASIDAANATRIARLQGSWRTGAAGGALTLRFATEVVNSAVIVRRGSWGRLF